MTLLKFEYSDADWEIQDLDLGKVNLILGKNATGKTRTLVVLVLLIKILNEKFVWKKPGIWKIELYGNACNHIIYNFSINNSEGNVASEELSLNNEVILNRKENGSCLIKNFLTSQFEEIYPPKNKLALHTTRDLKKFPIFEDLIEWAENSFGFLFANVNPYTTTNQYEFFFADINHNSIPELFKSLNEESRLTVLHQLKTIGFNITTIGYTEDIDKRVTINVTEDAISSTLPHHQLSQGMYRALSLVIFLENLVSKNKPYLLVIDDLCEGLDYDRAKKLGELIFNRCLSSNIQLIATSNDVFLMDVVDIKYWNVLTRTGNKVATINYKNTPEVFDDFRFTGLSNFDFFASDFIKQELE